MPEDSEGWCQGGSCLKAGDAYCSHPEDHEESKRLRKATKKLEKARKGEAKHPMQPVIMAPDNVHRFKENKIVSFLLETSPNDLNRLVLMPFSQEDWEQFYQLIGYSVCGFCDLGGPSEKVKDKAWAESEKLANLPRE